MHWSWPLLLAVALSGCPGDGGDDGGYARVAPGGPPTTAPEPHGANLGGDAPDDVVPAKPEAG